MYHQVLETCTMLISHGIIAHSVKLRTVWYKFEVLISIRHYSYSLYCVHYHTHTGSYQLISQFYHQ